MRGKVLLGWLTREEAVRFLQNDCIFDPPLTNEQAEALWAEKKAAVDALEVRAAPSPAELNMTQTEREAANRFLAFLRNNAGALGVVQRVVKLDPRGLVCRQLDVNLDKANEYLVNIDARRWCERNCLRTNRANANLPVANVLSNGWSFTIPHAEFMFAFNGQAFSIIQGGPHVSVSVLQNRTILWAGYHRCYARAAMVNPEANDRSVLAALTTEAGLATATNQSLRDLLFGDRPALLSDFFDERLCIEVELHRKRYELQIRAEVARISAD